MINLWRPIPALIPQANSRFSRKVAIGATIIFKWRAWLFVRANAEARKEPFIIYFFWGVILAEWIRPRSPSVFYQILYSTPSQVLRPFFSKKRKRERGKKSVGRCKKVPCKVSLWKESRETVVYAVHDRFACKNTRPWPPHSLFCSFFSVFLLCYYVAVHLIR